MSDQDRYSVEAARQAAEGNELGRWVARFLSSPGSDNEPLAATLSEQNTSWTGPVRLPISSLNRLAGPPEDPVLCPVDDDEWDDRVDDMAERIDEDGWEPSPLIVTYRNGQLVLEDGNHRAESLRRAGRRHAWAVVGFESDRDRAEFEAGIAS
jgi:hypothetical protein